MYFSLHTFWPAWVTDCGLATFAAESIRVHGLKSKILATRARLAEIELKIFEKHAPAPVLATGAPTPDQEAYAIDRQSAIRAEEEAIQLMRQFQAHEKDVRRYFETESSVVSQIRAASEQLAASEGASRRRACSSIVSCHSASQYDMTLLFFRHGRSRGVQADGD